MFGGAKKSFNKIVSHDGFSNLSFQKDQKIYLIVIKKKQESVSASFKMGMEDLCDLTQEELQEIEDQNWLIRQDLRKDSFKL